MAFYNVEEISTLKFMLWQKLVKISTFGYILTLLALFIFWIWEPCFPSPPLCTQQHNDKRFFWYSLLRTFLDDNGKMPLYQDNSIFQILTLNNVYRQSIWAGVTKRSKNGKSRIFLLIYRWRGCHNILDRISPKICLIYFSLESPCHTLKKKHVFWYPLSSGILLNISKHLFTNISEQNTQKCPKCFISWLVHSLLYSWQSFSLTTWSQKITTSA